MNSKRVFVIGLDGSTFDLLDPWVAEGKLPNLKRMLERSTFGRLESTIPPVTPPAWTSFMTGVNPGKHGVFDFYAFNPNSFEKGLVNSSHVRSKRFWDLAGERGKRSIILYVPLTYPPQRLEGVMISGIPAPLHGELIYPKEMEEELKKKSEKWLFEVDLDKLRDFHEGSFLKEIYQTLEARIGVANYLVSKEWDIFVLVIMETDWMQHFLWGERERYLLPFYAKIDGMIGHFIDSLTEEDTILILSDHGFGEVSRTFYINSWLRKEGFLSSRRRWVRSDETLDLGMGPHKKQSTLMKKIKWPRIKGRSGIDWRKTQAYSVATGWLWGVRVNLMGKEPKGIVKPEEYDDLRKRIVEELRSAVDEEEGRRVMEGVYPREDIYWGPYTKNGHDIIFTPDCECTLSDRIKDKIFRKNEKAGSSHRRDGILILCGPGIKKGKKITGAHIMDVAPMILYLLGLPIPKDIDGRVLTEALEPEILKAYPVRYEDIPLGVEGPKFVMTGAEEEEVRKSLRGLGYFE